MSELITDERYLIRSRGGAAAAADQGDANGAQGSVRRVFVLTEEPEERYAPFMRALERLGAVPTRVDLTRFVLDLDRPPEPGVYWSRLSGSASFRGHSHAAAAARAALEVVAHYAERSPGEYSLVNRASVDLEDCKVTQMLRLREAGFRCPPAILSVGCGETDPRVRDALGRHPVLRDCRRVVWKPVRGGSSAGVRVVPAPGRASPGEASEGGGGGAPELCQKLLTGEGGVVYRVEVVGGECLYVLRVDAEALKRLGASSCPCAAKRRRAAASEADRDPHMRVMSRREWGPALRAAVRRCEGMGPGLGLEVFAVEFVADSDGTLCPIDLNTNTNYRERSERAAGLAPDDGGVLAVSRLVMDSLPFGSGSGSESECAESSEFGSESECAESSESGSVDKCEVTNQAAVPSSDEGKGRDHLQSQLRRRRSHPLSGWSTS